MDARNPRDPLGRKLPTVCRLCGHDVLDHSWQLFGVGANNDGVWEPRECLWEGSSVGNWARRICGCLRYAQTKTPISVGEE